MDRSCRNIIEASITPEEFEELYDGAISLHEYLSAVPYQQRRYWDLRNLAFLRNDDDLAEYFETKSGLKFVDWCE